jgi:hypothetical protein
MAAGLWPLLRHHALGGLLENDDGVYYNAAAHLAAGQLPYRAFAFLQPPGGIVLVAAVNAALLMRLMRCLAGPVAAAAAGITYPVWGGAADTERTVLIEQLLGLTLLTASAIAHGRRGAACSARDGAEDLGGRRRRGPVGLGRLAGRAASRRGRRLGRGAGGRPGGGHGGDRRRCRRGGRDIVPGPRAWAVPAIAQVALVTPQTTFTYYYTGIAAPVGRGLRGSGCCQGLSARSAGQADGVPAPGWPCARRRAPPPPRRSPGSP